MLVQGLLYFLYPFEEYNIKIVSVLYKLYSHTPFKTRIFLLLLEQSILCGQFKEV